MATQSYFGRSWNLTVKSRLSGETWTLSSSSSTLTEPLRICFDVSEIALSQWWWGDIEIYNPSLGLQDLIQQGDEVYLSAGYQKPQSQYPLIFQGRVFQPLWERSSVTDYKLTLHCLVGKWEDDHGQVSAEFSKEMTDYDCVEQVLSQIEAQPEYLDESLKERKKPRGGSFSGTARLFFDQIARDHSLACWWGWNGLNIRSLAPQGEIPNLVYAPPQSDASLAASLDNTIKYTLLGSPQQTQEGIGFRVLLDSDLKLASLVKLDFSLLRKLALQPMQLPPRLDKDGLYVVAAINHRGDSRGNEWYSDVTAVTRGWSQMYQARAY